MAAETNMDPNIIEGPSEVIGILVLRSLGLEDLWDEHELGYDYNPTTDVVEWCDGKGLSVDRNDWDADRPMYSEIDYEVGIRDPEKTKAFMLKRIWQLIGERDKTNR